MRIGITVIIALVLGSAPPLAVAQASGKALYDSACADCRGVGVRGAPKPGDTAVWGACAQGGIDGIVKSAIDGTGKGVPTRGARTDFGGAQTRAAVGYTTAVALGAAPAANRTAAARAEIPNAAAAWSPATAPALAATSAAPPAVAPPTPPADDVNAFNRLLRPIARINRLATESGTQDPANDVTPQLQRPADAFATFPKAPAGNRVDWVKALDAKVIAPRWNRSDPASTAVVLDLNIVREVKGSMPDVVFPHKQHTEWLECANCHPAIFIPQKGANEISMASILQGQKCGVCHGKVAFPVSECQLCHSRRKAVANAASESKP